MNFLIVGCGSIGKRHTRNFSSLKQGDEKVYVFDTDRNAAQSFAKEVGAEILDDLDKAGGAGIKGAVICVPNNLHVPLARQLMQQGVGVLVEKPMSHTLDGLDDVIALGRRDGVVLMTGYNLRHHPNLLDAKQILDGNQIGTVKCARFFFGYNLSLWRPAVDYRKNYGAIKAQGGGVILDVIHEINCITWLLGDVAEVSCMMGKLSSLEIDTEDAAAIHLKMKSGAIVELHLDYIDMAYDRGFRIVGENGTVVWDMPAMTLKSYAAATKTWTEMPNKFDFNETYLSEARHFIAALRGTEEPYENGNIGKRDLEIVIAAKESAISGRRIAI
jgi:predicted dehydrogenase